MTSRSRCVLVAVTAPLAIALAGCASGSSSPAASSSASGAVASSATPATAPAATTSPAGPASSVNPGGPKATATGQAAGGGTGHTAECTAGQLAVAYTSNAQIRGGALDGMSHADSVVTFTNVSHQTCRIRGYPGVAALDSSGRQIRQAARGQAANGQTPLITLAPGQVASAEITGNTASCSAPIRIAGLLITVPDQRTSTRLAGPQLMCLDSLGINPLQRGNTGGLSL